MSVSSVSGASATAPCVVCLNYCHVLITGVGVADLTLKLPEPFPLVTALPGHVLEVLFSKEGIEQIIFDGAITSLTLPE